MLTIATFKTCPVTMTHRIYMVETKYSVIEKTKQSHDKLVFILDPSFRKMLAFDGK